MVESINITSMEVNWAALAARGAGIIAVQEHKLAGAAMKSEIAKMTKAGWQVQMGQCDGQTKIPTAGVGALCRGGAMTMVKAAAGPAG